MPALSRELFSAVLQLCEPHFRTPEDRDAILLPVLSTWPDLAEVEWSGNGRAFTSRLIYRLPGTLLKEVLLVLPGGPPQQAYVLAVCGRIDDELTLTQQAGSDPVRRYYQETVDLLSAPRYELDRRFVQLTLLLDQGAEATGGRFVPDGRPNKFDSLAAVLEDIDERAVVVLGRPGSGKTTLLRHLQLERSWAELAIGQRSSGSRIVPFFASLNGYRGAKPGDNPPDPLSWLTAEWQLRQPNLPDFRTLFESGRLLLLLDGLNEIPHTDPADYRDRLGQWQTFLQQTAHFGNTTIFSCRSLDYSAPLGSETSPVRQVRIEPLSPEQIKAFLELYLAEETDPIWQALRADEDQLELFATPFFLRLLVDQIEPGDTLPAGRVALLTGFIRRALYRETAERRHRLFAPGVLLDEDDVQQIIQMLWPAADPYWLPSGGVLISSLELLAFRMQDGQRAGEGGQVRVAERLARDLLSDAPASDVINAGIQLNVLDKDVMKRELSYFHQLIQEYFAARLAARESDPQRVSTTWHVDEVRPTLAETIDSLEVSEPLPPLPATGWEETTVMAAAMSADPERFVAELMPVNLPLAARCAAAAEVIVSPDLIGRLQEALLERTQEPAADLRARIAAAEALGELGDPRFDRRHGPHGSYLKPPLVTIPAGTYQLGDDSGQYDDEKPAHSVPLEGFEVGMFPVTNAEYRLFLQAGGYEDERWWETDSARAWQRGEGTAEGQKAVYRDLAESLRNISEDQLREIPTFTPEQLDAYFYLRSLKSGDLEEQLDEWFPAGRIYSEPEFWDDSRFSHPAQPVVGVSWLEANAYCAWLSAQTGELFSLPTEAEWEAAASGPKNRAYSFGPDFDTRDCNTFESHLRRTAPIGVYPKNKTPEGVYDLSGNVWEWTTTIFRPYPYVWNDGREERSDAEARRVLRGGSWLDAQSGARSAYRNANHPVNRYDYSGFRVVRRPPSRSL